MELSGFIIGTMGAAYSENCTDSIVPSSCSLLSSSSIFPFMAYGTGRALQNFGTASTSTRILAFGPVKVPKLSSKTSQYGLINFSSLDSTCFSSIFILNNFFQSSFTSFNQSLPSKLGPDPSTTSVDSSFSCP